MAIDWGKPIRLKSRPSAVAVIVAIIPGATYPRRITFSDGSEYSYTEKGLYPVLSDYQYGREIENYEPAVETSEGYTAAVLPPTSVTPMVFMRVQGADYIQLKEVRREGPFVIYERMT